jgi:GNAT superfamily N-acetyltransferase
VLVLSGAAYLYYRSGKMHTMRANRLRSMLTQLDAILEGEGEDALPQDAAAAAPSSDDADRVVVTIGTTALAEQDPTLAQRITTMVNTSYTRALADQLPPGGVYERTSVPDVLSRLSMGDDGARANRVLHLAWRREQLVGICSSTYQPPWCEEGCGHWGLVVVDVSAQGTGVASALVRAAEERLAGACEQIQIEYEYTPGHEYSERLYEWCAARARLPTPPRPRAPEASTDDNHRNIR